MDYTFLNGEAEAGRGGEGRGSFIYILLSLNLFLFQWVGSECGHHAAYTFYKGVQYLAPGAPDQESKGTAQGPWKVLSIGQFFFVKIWGESDLVSVAELQLLWEDKVDILYQGLLPDAFSCFRLLLLGSSSFCLLPVVICSYLYRLQLKVASG